MVDYVLPRGGTAARRSTSVPGRYLDDPREILFYTRHQGHQFEAGYTKPAEVKAQFQIAPDCPLGEHVLRVRTATGSTEAMTFWVDRFPTVMETETRSARTTRRRKRNPSP